MSALGLKILDENVQTTNKWVKEVDELAGFDNRQRAYRLLRAVLHVIRDNLLLAEVAQLGAQLPTFIRGVYYEAWDPSVNPAKLRNREDVIARLQQNFSTDPLEDPERAFAAVFRVLEAHVSAGEMEHVRASFTRDVREMLEAA